MARRWLCSSPPGCCRETDGVFDQKIKDVQEHDVDVFVMGDDWKGQFDFLKDYCEVVYLPRTEGISTTKIKDDLKDKL